MIKNQPNRLNWNFFLYLFFVYISQKCCHTKYINVYLEIPDIL